MAMIEETKFEALDTAFRYYLNCMLTGLEARAESRLFDVAVENGMPFDEPNVSEWAAKELTAAMLAA